MDDRIFRINKITISICWIAIFCIFLLDLSTDSRFSVFLVDTIIPTVLLGALTFFARKKTIDKIVPYIISIGMAIVAVASISQSSKDAGIANFVLLFFYIALMSIYHDFKIVTLTVIISVIVLFGSTLAFMNNLFVGLNKVQIYTFIILYLFTAIASMLQSKIGSEMIKDINNKEAKAVSSKEKIEAILIEVSSIVGAFKKFSGKLKNNVSNIRDNSRDVVRNFEIVTSSVTDNSQKMLEISEKVNAINENMKQFKATSCELNNTISENKASTNVGNQEISTLAKEINTVDKNVQDTVATMTELKDMLIDVYKILETITTISEQTNLLSLNASIEAARAGEQGKGFAIVAEEIKKLADTSKVSVQDINNILNSVYKKASDSIKIVEYSQQAVSTTDITKVKVLDSFKTISENTEKVEVVSSTIDDMVMDINNASDVILKEVASVTNNSETNAAITQNMLQNIAESEQNVINISHDFDRLQNMIEKLSELTSNLE